MGNEGRSNLSYIIVAIIAFGLGFEQRQSLGVKKSADGFGK